MNRSAMRHSFKSALIALPLCVMAACGGSGDGDPAVAAGFTSQTKANTYTAGEQQTPAIARNAAGNMVVVWDSIGQDGSLSGIFGQRYAGGQPVGPEFQANTYTKNKQNQPSVAMDAAGNFVVVWRSSGQDGNGGTIFGQRFAADGTRQGTEFQIGPSNSDFDSQADPSVAMNEKGQFVVAFSNRELSQIKADLELNAEETRFIQARAYGADGTAVGAPVTVFSTVIAIQRAPATGIDKDGNFTVAWLNDAPTGATDVATGSRGVYLRRYDATMTALAAKTAVSDSDGASDRPSLSMNPAGAFVITWERAVDQPELVGIYGRLYAADGTAVAPQFRVSTPAAGLYERSSVGMDSAGNFAVVAQSVQTNGGSAIFLQRYSADASPLGGSTPISDGGFASMYGKIAMAPAGGISLAWQSYGQDGSGRGIFLRTQ